MCRCFRNTHMQPKNPLNSSRLVIRQDTNIIGSKGWTNITALGLTCFELNSHTNNSPCTHTHKISHANIVWKLLTTSPLLIRGLFYYWSVILHKANCKQKTPCGTLWSLLRKGFSTVIGTAVEHKIQLLIQSKQKVTL